MYRSISENYIYSRILTELILRLVANYLSKMSRWKWWYCSSKKYNYKFVKTVKYTIME